MSELAQSFIAHLAGLKEHDRGAFAHLKRSLGFEPGAYPRAYPYVERFVGADRHADDPWRKALYLTAGLYASHPQHVTNTSLSAAFGHLARARGSASLETRFIALLGASPDSLSSLLRQVVSLLAADGFPCDYSKLLDDLARWYEAFDHSDEQKRDRVRQGWARDFYRAFAPAASANEIESETEATV
ncbi:type I-E CRISPR-associated protein Cse2/CasB [Methylolobus aquaticus]|nr:type I-E CRISPR-associated protein Cse2/CasB [Methylolobus aquaticus]